MSNDVNEGPIWSSQNPTDSPPPSSEPVYPPSAANEPPPPPAYSAAPQGYPPPPLGYAAAGYGAQVTVQPPVPAGINGLWQKFINVTTKPGAQSFTNELPTANWSDIWIALLGLGVITALTGFIRSLYVQAALAANNPLFSGLPSDQQQALDRIMSSTGSGAGNFGAIIWVPLGFFIGMGILFVSAKIFGGSGAFLDQSYTFMLYYVPINGLGALLGLVPILGGFAGFLL